MAIVRSARPGSRIGVLPGAFHPPTRAHLALGEAALALLDSVYFVLPAALPHKQYEGVPHADRLAMLLDATAHEPRFGVAVTEGGLYFDIARELRDALTNPAQVTCICGRDAAERVATWDYGDDRILAAMLQEFNFLVAAREGGYQAPPHLAAHMKPLPFTNDEVSATEVRDRIRRGASWRHLVPAQIQERVESLYS